jgi:hypothetical protein
LSSGRYQFSADSTLRWHIQSPIDSVIEITQNTISHYENGKQVYQLDTRKQAMAGIINQLFFAIFSNQWPQLEQHFTIQATADKQQWQLILRPKSPALQSFSDSITLAGAQQLENMTLLERSGDRLEITFVVGDSLAANNDG